MTKHLLHKNEAKVRQTMMEANQFGVSVPGGSDDVIHTRETFEALALGRGWTRVQFDAWAKGRAWKTRGAE